MTESILQEIKQEFINGYVERGHPFRCFTLGTSQNNVPRLRTVVLRNVLPDMTFMVYTDLRSPKIETIKHNDIISALFYHPTKQLQISITAKAEIITNPNELKTYWENVPDHSKKDYTSQLAPGSPINLPENVIYSDEESHFCVLKLTPTYIDYLHIKRPNHIRVGFTKNETGFKGEFLVP